jgi:hypothetical protein
MMHTIKVATVVLTSSLLAALAAAARPDDEGFTALVKGTDPSQFTLVGFDEETIRISPDGEIRLTGRPNGYFATKRPYKSYVLRFDWMYEPPEGASAREEFKGNSGLLVHIQEPHKVWPKCIEVQLENKDAGRTFAIFGSKFNGTKDADAQRRAIKPVGEWNSEEVRCEGDKITCTINGIEVARGDGAEPVGGTIGWQSEGAPIRFRNLRIKEL